MICSNCGFQNAAGDQFCGSCGKFLEWTGAEPESGSSPGERPSTGESGATDTDSPTTAFPTPAPTGQTPTRPTTPVRPTTAVPTPRPAPGPGAPVVCWNCGRSNPASRTFCQQCGERLGVATASGAAGAAGLAGAGSAGGRGGRAGPPDRASAGDGDNRGRLLAVGVAAVALLLLAGGAAALFLGGLGAAQPTPTPTLVALPFSPSPLALPTTSPSPSTPPLSPAATVTLPPTAGPTAPPTLPPTPPPTPRPTRRPTPTPPPTPQPTPANCDELAEPVDTITLTAEDPRRDIRPDRYWCVTQITFGDGVGDGVLKIFLTNPIFLTAQYGYSSERIGWNEAFMSGGTFGGSSVESPPMLIIDPVADLGRTHRLFPPGTIVEFEVTCSTPDCSGSVQIDRIRRIPPPP